MLLSWKRILQEHHTCVLCSFCDIAELTGTFFLFKLDQTVDLATPQIFAVSLMGLFSSFNLLMLSFTDSNTDFGLNNSWPHRIPNANKNNSKWTLNFLFASCYWHDEGLAHNRPWNSAPTGVKRWLLRQAPDLNVNTLKLKFKVWT